MMEVALPGDLSLTLTEVIAFLTIYGSLIGIYFRLNASLTALRGDFREMQQRNKHADEETEAVKAEQAAQKTTVAVMAQQIENQSKTIDRIDRNIEELMKRGRIE